LNFPFFFHFNPLDKPKGLSIPKKNWNFVREQEMPDMKNQDF